ncbi:flavin-dependent monooxygenas [Chamberlinius hualienensis]
MAYNGMPYDVTAFTRYNIFKWTQWSSKEQRGKDLLKLCAARIDRNLYGLPLTGYKCGDHILTINDHLPYSILTGRILMKNSIQKFTAMGVFFHNDPTEYPIDTVVMATGFDIPDLGFIKPITASDVRYGLYKRTFPSKLDHPTMAFIGLCRFDFATPHLAEMQSRWAVKVFTNKCQLPSQSEMKRELAAIPDTGTITKLPVQLSLPYLDDIAGFIGVKPNFFKLLFTDPRLYYKCIFGPFTNYQFRLVGPNKWPKAREIILTIPERVNTGFGPQNALTFKNNERKKKRCSVFSVTFGVTSVIIAYFLYQKWPPLNEIFAK